MKCRFVYHARKYFKNIYEFIQDVSIFNNVMSVKLLNKTKKNVNVNGLQNKKFMAI